MASSFSIASRPKKDNDADTMRDIVDESKDIYLPSYSKILRSNSQFNKIYSKVWDCCRSSCPKASGVTVVLHLITKFSLFLLSPPVELVEREATDSRGAIIRPILNGAGFSLQSNSKPDACATVNVRANICAPKEEGKYYFELRLPPSGTPHAVFGIGWCDYHWGKRKFGEVDDKSGQSLEHTLMSVGDDKYSWALDRYGTKFPRGPIWHVESRDVYIQSNHRRVVLLVRSSPNLIVY